MPFQSKFHHLDGDYAKAGLPGPVTATAAQQAAHTPTVQHTPIRRLYPFSRMIEPARIRGVNLDVGKRKPISGKKLGRDMTPGELDAKHPMIKEDKAFPAQQQIDRDAANKKAEMDRKLELGRQLREREHQEAAVKRQRIVEESRKRMEESHREHEKLKREQEARRTVPPFNILKRPTISTTTTSSFHSGNSHSPTLHAGHARTTAATSTMKTYRRQKNPELHF